MLNSNDWEQRQRRRYIGAFGSTCDKPVERTKSYGGKCVNCICVPPSVPIALHSFDVTTIIVIITLIVHSHFLHPSCPRSALAQQHGRRRRRRHRCLQPSCVPASLAPPTPSYGHGQGRPRASRNGRRERGGSPPLGCPSRRGWRYLGGLRLRWRLGFRWQVR